MALKLVVMTNAAGDVFELPLEHARYGVGRERDNDLRINESYVSGHHAELVRAEDGRYLLNDLRSSNGTFLNGQRLTGPVAVAAGDFIKFGILKVAVEAHEEGGPKIVALENRAAFSRPDRSSTGAIPPAGRESGSATAPVTGARSKTRPVSAPTPASAGKEGESDDPAQGARIEALEEALRAARAETETLRRELTRTTEDSLHERRKLEGGLSDRIKRLEDQLAEERDRSREAVSEKSRIEAETSTRRAELDSLRHESGQLRARQEEAARQLGRIQAELHQANGEKVELGRSLDSERSRTNELLSEIESLRAALDTKGRELAEREIHLAREAAETAQRWKRELGEAQSAREEAEAKAGAVLREKQTLAGAYERILQQLSRSEAELQNERETVGALTIERDDLSQKIGDIEASRSELSARIREDAREALALRDSIEKLERQLRENEFASLQRERERAGALEADLNRTGRRASELERQLQGLETRLEASTSACRVSEDRVLELESRLLEEETEAASVRALLAESEKARVGLASRLAAESSLVERHTRTIEGLRREFSESVSRYSAGEFDLLARHAEETETLLSELRDERGRREGLEVLLAHTRAGFSDALRHSREAGDRDRTRIAAEGLAKVSEVELHLSEAIHAGEVLEASRCALEDELNERDARIEALASRNEDLEVRLADEIEARRSVLTLLETTRAGFSEMLRGAWGRLSGKEAELVEAHARLDEATSLIAALRAEIEGLAETLAATAREHRAALREWEERHAALREEKLKRSGEEAVLRRLQEEVETVSEEKRSLEEELPRLNGEATGLAAHLAELRVQREDLLAEREELKSTLAAARQELKLVQRRNAEAKAEEKKQAGSIAAAEKRIESLRKLESELDQAAERRRRKYRLNRNEVFSEPAPEGGAEFPQEEFYRQLIAKLDLIDDLAKRYESTWRYPKLAEQFGILKRAFVEFLEEHSVKPFNLEPGTELSLSERKRIKLVPAGDGRVSGTNGPRLGGRNGKGGEGGPKPGNSRVVATLRPGYVYENGSEAVILRKAEVLVS